MSKNCFGLYIYIRNTFFYKQTGDKMITIINTTALIFGFIGTILLAFSVNPVFNSIKVFFKTFETIMKFNAENQNQIVIENIDKHLEKFALKKSKWLVYAGLVFILLGYILQLIALI